jgi:hypothetical protein
MAARLGPFLGFEPRPSELARDGCGDGVAASVEAGAGGGVRAAVASAGGDCACACAAATARRSWALRELMEMADRGGGVEAAPGSGTEGTALAGGTGDDGSGVGAAAAARSVCRSAARRTAEVATGGIEIWGSRRFGARGTDRNEGKRYGNGRPPGVGRRGVGS